MTEIEELIDINIDFEKSVNPQIISNSKKNFNKNILDSEFEDYTKTIHEPSNPLCDIMECLKNGSNKKICKDYLLNTFKIHIADLAHDLEDTIINPKYSIKKWMSDSRYSTDFRDIINRCKANTSIDQKRCRKVSWKYCQDNMDLYNKLKKQNLLETKKINMKKYVGITSDEYTECISKKTKSPRYRNT